MHFYADSTCTAISVILRIGKTPDQELALTPVNEN